MLRSFVGAFKSLGAMQMGCAWIGILVLFVWGAGMLITAHPIQPVKIIGVVASTSDHYQGTRYDYTEVSLQGDFRTYSVSRDGMEPPLASRDPAPGGAVAFWINPGINWTNVTTTEVLAASFGDESQTKPAHATSTYNDPKSGATRQRLVGGGVLGLVVVIIALAALWEWFTERHQPPRPPVSGDDRATSRRAKMRTSGP